MDNDFFLQHLRDLSLEEGRVFIQEHASELADHAAFGELVAEEALHQRDVNPFLSLKLSELLIFFGEYLHHLPSHALGLKAKGDILNYIEHHKAALECLDAAGEKFLELGDEVNWARSRIAWIVSCAWVGRVDEALQEATRARDVFIKQNEHYWACIVDHNTAVICSQIGQYQKALDLYERMLTIYPTVTDKSEALIKRAMAIAQMNQGRNLSWLGSFEEAYRLLQKAQASFIELEQTGFAMNTEYSLAELDYAQGYYGSALRRYYQVQDSLIQNNFEVPELLASIILRMAACLVKLNRAQEACRLANEAVEVYRQRGASLLLSDALREYAATLIASDKSREALQALDEASTLFIQGGFDHHAYTTKLEQAELLLQMHSFDTAYEQAKLTKEYFEAQGLVSRSVHASRVMAEALVGRIKQIGRQQAGEQHSRSLEEAVLLCEQATYLALQHNLQEQAYKSQYLLGQLAIIQEDLEKAAGHYDAAIDQIEYILDDLGYDLSPSFLHTTWAVYEDMISLCLQQGQVDLAFNYLERARSMALRQYLNKSKTFQDERKEQEGFVTPSVLQMNSAVVLQIQSELGRWQERYHKYSMQLVTIDTGTASGVDREVIQTELRRCEAKLSELFERLHLLESHSRPAFHIKKSEASNTQRIDIAELRQHLVPHQLLLTYFLYKRKLVIFAATIDGLIVSEISDGAIQLEHLLPLLHAHLQPSGWPDLQHPPQQAIRRLLNKLYNLLVAPVKSLLPSPSGYLTIVPYGPLHKLPFHALYDGSHFLIEDFQINYLPASSILMHLETLRSEQKVPSTSANGHTVSDKRQGLLPAIAGKPPLVFGYSGNGHLERALDEAKTVATLLEGRCYLERDATIARLIEQAPDSPIIHLATHGHSRLDAPNFSYVQLADGQLNAIDAFSLDLKGCELVTLSGCETGLALTGGGDEQLGLGRAFLAAGAASLVMSLWSVEDNATNELMLLFYRNLLKGDTKVQALRAAQCSLLHRKSSIYTHPYFWSAFRLVGEVGSLKFQEAKDYTFASKPQPLKK